ncbi:MAG TPA: ATP-binding cassette domain-containing protein [Candidatus Limnocylindria bacterium]|nr:ATP-binding cassette domain-containing protein [Candidatus Limnocylindria bacterium]
MTSARAIETRDLTRRFGSRIAVDRLNLSVNRSEVYGFVGPNGAGKTTTIRMLLGLIAGSSGEIELLGRPVRRGSVDLAGVGAIVDKPGFYPHLSGIDNLNVLNATRGSSIPRPQLTGAMKLAGLDPVDRRPPLCRGDRPRRVRSRPPSQLVHPRDADRDDRSLADRCLDRQGRRADRPLRARGRR